MLRYSTCKSGACLFRGIRSAQRHQYAAITLQSSVSHLYSGTQFPRTLQQRRQYAVAAEETSKGVVSLRDIEGSSVD